MRADSVAAGVSSKRRIDVFAPWVGFPIAYGLVFGIGSLNVFPAQPVGYQWALFMRPVALHTPILAGIGLVAYFASSFGVVRLERYFTRSRPHCEWTPNRTQRVVLVASAVALAGVIVILHRGGVPLLSGHTLTSRLTTTERSGFLVAVYNTAVQVAAAFATILALRISRSRLTLALWLIVLAFVSITSLLQGGRATLAEVALLVVPLIQYSSGQFFRVRHAAVLGLVVVVAAGLFGFWRESQFHGSVGNYQQTYARAGVPVAVQPIAEPYEYMRDTVVAFSTLVDLVPSHFPFQLGKEFMGGASAFLPGHHDTPDVLVKRLLGLQFTTGVGTPPSLLGIFYLDFGAAGIVVGMAALGTLLQALYSRHVSSGSTGSALAYSYAVKVAFWSLFVGPFPYATTLIVPIALFLGADYASHGATPGKRPVWLLGGVAAVLLSFVWAVFKYQR